MKSRDKTVIAIVLMLVVALGGYYVLVHPKHKQATQLDAQIVSAQNALSQAEAEVQTALAAEAEYKTYVKQLKAINTAVPSDDQIPELINQLQSASTRNKIGFQAVSLAGGAAATATPASTTSTTFPSENFSLSFTGGYFSVARLLGNLAALVRADNKHFHATGRLLSIGTLSLSPGTSGKVAASVTATDYDVPASLLPTSSTAATTATSTSTGTPAAYVTH
jgi:Tfp pilus assembly protein PilO